MFFFPLEPFSVGPPSSQLDKVALFFFFFVPYSSCLEKLGFFVGFILGPKKNHTDTSSQFSRGPEFGSDPATNFLDNLWASSLISLINFSDLEKSREQPNTVSLLASL